MHSMYVYTSPGLFCQAASALASPTTQQAPATEAAAPHLHHIPKKCLKKHFKVVLLAFFNTAAVTIQFQIIFFLTDKPDSSLALLTASPPSCTRYRHFPVPPAENISQIPFKSMPTQTIGQEKIIVSSWGTRKKLDVKGETLKHLNQLYGKRFIISWILSKISGSSLQWCNFSGTCSRKKEEKLTERKN